MKTVAPLVLLVDDFEDIRAMYAEYLTLAGYRVVEASDGRQALARAVELLPNLLVMDLSLPVLDGWATLRELRSDVRTEGIPVIVLTGHARAGYSRRARDAGFASFLTKPCMPAVLWTVVRDVLARAHSSTGKKSAT